MAQTVYVSPRSQVADQNGRTFPRVHRGATNSRDEEGLGVQASLGADSTWQLRFAIPPTLAATPNATLRLRVLANATTGAAKVDPQWAIVPAGQNPDTAALNAEGTQTVTWAAGDNDDYKELDVVLDAAAFAQGDAGRELVMHLVFKTTAWTLGSPSTWIPYLKIDVG